ncbi:cation:proton antiporter [Kitasatospora sp. NPDC058170]|uniref:cation:proton antiporter n=1 Tax=Kitasatospora sp. NPDC058170 TaxID=3346364 RepID=UPI0036DC8270
MDLLHLLRNLAHAAAALAVVMLIAAAGRGVARRLRQPEVIGEMTAGLLLGPAVIALVGRSAFHDDVLPGPVLGILKFTAQTGLVLFLVGLANELRWGPHRPPRNATGWVAAGALVPPLLTGVLLVGWIQLTGDTAARGGAPLPAYVLMVAVTMAITAVPVMARILLDRNMTDSVPGRLGLASAIVIDAVGWLLLSVAISLGSGDLTRSLHSLRALAAGALCALAIRYLLRTRAAGRLGERHPRTTAVLLGAAALATALTMEHLGMTAILGAALAGLSIPRDESGPWPRAVAAVTRAGRALTPAFFVFSGITVLTGAFSSASWPLIGCAVLLGCAGKGLGGYAGARLGGQPPGTARRVGVLMNTRGLTELIVLQAGFSAGILPAPLVLALVVMALTTTAMTGPLLDLLDRADRRHATAPGVPVLPVSPVTSVTPTAPTASAAPLATEGGTR